MVEDLEAESFIEPQNDKDYGQTKPNGEESIPKTCCSISNMLLLSSMRLNIFVLKLFQHHHFFGDYPATSVGGPKNGSSKSAIRAMRL
jgi:hypothetical protein